MTHDGNAFFLQWKPEREHVEVEEKVEWLPNCTEPCPTPEGKRKSRVMFTKILGIVFR